MTSQQALLKGGHHASPGGHGSGLEAGLKNRHLSMIAFGGAIGAGLFVGSSIGIATAGPGILLSYLLVSILVLLVMRMLGEMSAADPSSGSFSAHADRALGNWAGFSIGWLYWFFWVVVLAVEATAGAKILAGWVPAVPQWGWALIVMVVLTATNLISVGSYGEFEFWFAGIKVVAICTFIVVGLLAVFGVLPGVRSDQAGFGNLTKHDGFLPHGPGSILTGVLLVVFSFMGSEIAPLAASETEDPQRAVIKSTKSVIWRIAICYLGSLLVVVLLVPWNDKSITQRGSYDAALDSLGIAHAGQITNFVVLTSVLSCLNSGLYTASRMAFSLGVRGDAPKAFARTNGRGVPMTAIGGSVVFGFVAVFFNYKFPDTIFLFLVDSSSAVALFVWLVICLSQLRMRKTIQREAPEKLVMKIWLYPYLTWATAALIVFILGYMLTDTEHDGRETVLLSILVAGIVLTIAAIRQKLGGRSPGRAAGRKRGPLQ
jgi:GABA permease